MKRLLVPFIALAFCAPAYGESRSFEISELPPLPATSRECTGSRIACATPLGPTPASKKASFKRGDSLASFLKRHGITSDQLKRYNPGLELSRLTVGREVYVAPRINNQPLLTIRPTVTGATSWPERPSLPVRESSRARAVRARIQSNRNYAASSYANRWRRYGNFEVDWQGWKLHSNGSRSTTIKYKRDVDRLAISCKATTLSYKVGNSWTKWIVPARNTPGERILIDLCSNVTGG